MYKEIDNSKQQRILSRKKTQIQKRLIRELEETTQKSRIVLAEEEFERLDRLYHVNYVFPYSELANEGELTDEMLNQIQICPRYTRISYYVRQTRNKWSSFPNGSRTISGYSKRLGRDYTLHLPPVPHSKLIKRLQDPNVILSPFTGLAISPIYHSWTDWVALEFDADGLVGESQAPNHLNCKALDLLKDYGFIVHVMLSGSRSIHLKSYFKQRLPKEEAMLYVDCLRYGVKGLRPCADNLSSAMRVEGFYHRSAWDHRLNNWPLPKDFLFDTDHLSRFLGTRSKDEVWVYQDSIERSDWNLEKVRDLKRILQTEFGNTTHRLQKSSACTNNGHIERCDHDIDSVREPEKQGVKRFGHQRIRLVDEHVNRVLSQGIPQGQSWFYLIETNLVYKAVQMFGKENGRLKLEDSIRVHGTDETLKDRKSKLDRQMDLLPTNVETHRKSKYSTIQLSKFEVQVELCRDGLKRKKDKCSRFLLREAMEVVDYMYAKIFRFGRAHIGVEEITSHLSLSFRSTNTPYKKRCVLNWMNLVCVHINNPSPPFPLFNCVEEYSKGVSRRDGKRIKVGVGDNSGIDKTRLWELIMCD